MNANDREELRLGDKLIKENDLFNDHI